MKKSRPVHDRIARDIATHFHDRLQLLLSDTLDTANRAGIDNGHAVLVLITGMMVEVIKGSIILKMDRPQFAGFCGDTYREIKRVAAEEDDE